MPLLQGNKDGTDCGMDSKFMKQDLIRGDPLQDARYGTSYSL
jgi:hypothetical protein